jgi:alpha-1,3-rhamnosyl/mannosyltransferase
MRTLAARDRGLDFTVLASRAGVFPELEGVPNWRVENCPGAEGGNLRKAWFIQARLPGLVSELGGDILHSMQFLAPVRKPCPLVVTVYDLAWLHYPETLEWARRMYYKWLVPRTLRSADLITAISQSTAAETREAFPGTASRIRVVPLGLPLWVQDARGGGAADGAPPGPPYFLFVGTMEPRKNLARLLDAYGIFRETAQRDGRASVEIPRLVLVGGKGWRDGALRSHLKQYRDRGWLELLDYRDDVALWDLYRGALALVFPSLHEGFGLPILEAMAASCPVLTSNRGGMKEVAGQRALLVDPASPEDIAEGLEVMAFKQEIRAELARGGPEHARAWSWDLTADRTEAVYRELLGRYPDK